MTISKDKLKDRNKLVTEHVYLVRYVVNRMSIKTPPGMGYDDLLSIGCWGLLDAANKYKVEKGIKFKTYALTRIKGSILDELRRNSLGGQTLCRKARALEKAIQAVEKRAPGKPATDAAVSTELGISLEKLDQLYTDVSCSFLVSLDEHCYSDDTQSETRGNMLPDKPENNPSVLVESIELSEKLTSLISEIPSSERQVLVLYYYEELTFKEIGFIIGVSESRISQIHTKAMMRLRARLQNQRDTLRP